NVWLRTTLITLLVILIFLIGFSRIYLRYHYASDVAAGFCVGAIWLILSLWVTTRIENYSRKEIEPELQAG
ncbi:MAG TPA: phosphatase PAP2 family protein, partial [Chitinophagaceae bacterium]|nr:phosphatase PAP2 family protein [Chitinophagaceae bacterium]